MFTQILRVYFWSPELVGLTCGPFSIYMGHMKTSKIFFFFYVGDYFYCDCCEHRPQTLWEKSTYKWFSWCRNYELPPFKFLPESRDFSSFWSDDSSWCTEIIWSPTGGKMGVWKGCYDGILFWVLYAPEVGILVGTKWSVMRDWWLHKEETRGKYPGGELEFLIKQRGLCYASWLEETKYKGLMPQQEQSPSQIAGVWLARTPSLPLTRGLFVVEAQTLGKCSPRLWEGGLCVYLANSLKGPYDTKNRHLIG